MAETVSRKDNQSERLITWEDAEKLYNDEVMEAQRRIMAAAEDEIGTTMAPEIARWFVRNKYKSYHLSWTKEQKQKGKNEGGSGETAEQE